MIVKSTWLQRKNIKKVTWSSPDGITCNQIDHVLIERRHASDILDVHSCRGADWDSDHFLVRIKYRQKIDVARTTNKRTIKKYDMEKLIKNEQKRDDYQMKVTETFQNSKESWETKYIKGKWSIVKNVLKTAAETVVGVSKRKEREEWFDNECATAVAKSE